MKKLFFGMSTCIPPSMLPYPGGKLISCGGLEFELLTICPSQVVCLWVEPEVPRQCQSRHNLWGSCRNDGSLMNRGPLNC